MVRRGYDVLDRLIAITDPLGRTTHLEYDANGNLDGDGVYRYVWDDRDRLSAIQQGESLIASFGYDPIGRRISKTVGGQTAQYLHDGWQIVQEQNGEKRTCWRGLAWMNSIAAPETAPQDTISPMP